MSKELAYTKDPNIHYEDQDGCIVMYYANKAIHESEIEADGNCKLFSQAGAMYELFQKLIDVKPHELWELEILELQEKAEQIIKKVES